MNLQQSLQRGNTSCLTLSFCFSAFLWTFDTLQFFIIINNDPENTHQRPIIEVQDCVAALPKVFSFASTEKMESSPLSLQPTTTYRPRSQNFSIYFFYATSPAFKRTYHSTSMHRGGFVRIPYIAFLSILLLITHTSWKK